MVVGHPITLGGERGEQARETERFAALLRADGQHPTVLTEPGAPGWAFVTATLPRVWSFLERAWSA